jgi:hypothetical protein
MEKRNFRILSRMRKKNRVTRYQMENWKKEKYKKMSRLRKRGR